MVRRPELVTGVSASAFIRMTDAWQPTWLLDEADRYLNPKNAGEALTAAINASRYRRMARKKISCRCRAAAGTAGVHVLVPDDPGRHQAAGRHGAGPLDRAGDAAGAAGRAEAPADQRHLAAFQEIQRKLVRWAQDLPELDLDPVVPAFLHNREADLWRPLFALAAVAGGRWPARVEAAARAIHGQRAEESARLVELLEAIREVFGD